VYERPFDSDKLARRMAALLDGPRAGLVTDIDGTISPIAALPEEARVLPKAVQALDALRWQLRLVGVVSGRRAADARAMVGLDGLTYVGNHGYEMLTAAGPRLVPEAAPWLPRLASALQAVRRELAHPAGVVIEDKVATGALHYRLAPDPDQARCELLAILGRDGVRDGLRIEEGRRVINVLPPLGISKGSAVTSLAREYGLERIVYFGDDVTDTHAFTALRALRAQHLAHTLAIGVLGQDTPPSVRELADTTVPSAHAVADVLSRLSEMLETSARMVAGVPIVLSYPQDESRSTSHGQRRPGNGP
jgi:trehalose-phosphatase